MPSHTSYTPRLNEQWDLTLTKGGSIEMLSSDDATKQNVANECRLFYGDAYFRFDEGIKWFSDQLGKPLQKVVTASRLRTAAESVNGVRSVDDVEISGLNTDTRTLEGTIYITTDNGVNSVVNI